MYPIAESGGHSTVPAFLSKLWTLVEDPNYNHLICWDETGQSFHVYEQAQFAKEVLPLYFKHSNIASFIRQLNMYGFRKVLNVEQGGLKSEKDDLEFQHPYFIRGEEHLLEHIKRKVHKPFEVSKMVSLKPSLESLKIKEEDLSKVLTDVTSLRGRQDHMNLKLDNMKRENEALWREVANLRQKHSKQQQIINKLIGFLVTLVGGNHRAGLKRKMPLMLPDASQVAAKSPKLSKSYTVEETEPEYTVQSPQSSSSPPVSGPIIHDVTDFLNIPDTDSDSASTNSTLLVPSPQKPSPPVVKVTEERYSPPHKAPDPIIKQPSSPLTQKSPGKSNFDLPRFNDANFGKAEFMPSYPPIPPELCLEMANHLDGIQLDINSLKDVLGSPSYSLDPSLLVGLFDADAPLSPHIADMATDPLSPSTSTLTTELPIGNELVQYTPLEDVPSLLDLADDSSDLLPNDQLPSSDPFLELDLNLDTPLPLDDNCHFKLPDTGISPDDLD